MKAWTRWQDWVSLVLGVLLFISPWVFGTATNGASSWDAWIIGVLGVLLALWALAFLSTASIAVPPYLLHGRVVSLGNPARGEFLARLRRQVEEQAR